MLGQTKAKPKLVVLGGGPGGGTVARFVNKDAAGAIDVTMIEPNRQFTTCFFSNIYVGGYRSFQSITHNYDKVRKEGVRIVPALASAIDRDKKQVMVGKQSIPYDRLVIAPGIDLKWDSVPGYSEAAAQTMPHAWKPGAQTQLLVKRLNALNDGALIVMIAPPNPYRCPPGPYERVSMFAHVLKAKGHKKSKIVILDTKPAFSKQGALHRRLAAALSRHDRVAGPEGPWRHQGRQSEDQRGDDRSRQLQGAARQRDPGADRRPDRAHGRARRQVGLLPDRSGQHALQDGRQHLCGRRRLHPGPDAEVGVLRQQPGQGRGDDDPRRARWRQDLPGALLQHLLEPDRDRRRHQGRRHLRAGGDIIKESSTFVSKPGEPADIRKANYQESIDWYNSIVGDIFG